MCVTDVRFFGVQCETGKKWAGKARPQLIRSRPVSRVLSGTVIHLGYASPRTSCDLPRDDAGHANVPLFGLAPDGVYPATPVTSSAVRSYHTISPLPAYPQIFRRYIFCGTFRRLTPPRCYLASCPVKPGLSSMPEDQASNTATIRPTPPPTIQDKLGNKQAVQDGNSARQASVYSHTLSSAKAVDERR